MDKKIILSLDGGGIRGTTSIFILSYLEKKIRQKISDPDFKIGSVMDFVAGTSTGSIIGSLLIYPDDKGGLKYSADDILKMYVEISAKIFKRSLGYKIKSLWGMNLPVFPTANIDHTLSDIYGDLILSDLVKPCLFTSYDIKKREIRIFTNHDKNHKFANYPVKEVIRGSTSIPGFFKPQYFLHNGIENTLIDGGVFANNPSISAFIENSKTVYEDGIKNYSPNDVLFLSVGTGETPDKSYNFDRVKGRGILFWLKPTLDILTDSSSELVDYEMRKLFATSKDNYIRLNVNINKASTSALDASKENVDNLISDSENYIRANHLFLNVLIDKIIEINIL